MNNIMKTVITAVAVALMGHQVSAQTVIDALPYVISTAGDGTPVAFGILAMNQADITVKNGAIVGFDQDIVFGYTSGLNINHNHLVDGVRFSNEQLFAIVLHHSYNCLVQICAIADTGYDAKGNIVSAQGTGIDVSLTNQGASNALMN